MSFYVFQFKTRILKGIICSQIKALRILRILREERSYWCWVHLTSVV